MYYFCSGLLILILEGQSELVLVELKERLCDESPHLEPDVILKKNKVCKQGLGFRGMEGFGFFLFRDHFHYCISRCKGQQKNRDNKRKKEDWYSNSPVTLKIKETTRKLMRSLNFYITELPRRHFRGIITKINVIKIVILCFIQLLFWSIVFARTCWSNSKW